MDLITALTFTFSMLVAYCIVLWIQFCAHKKADVEIEKLIQKVDDLEKVVQRLCKEAKEPKKITTSKEKTSDDDTYKW
jgi:hypothetical protein